MLKDLLPVKVGYTANKTSALIGRSFLIMQLKNIKISKKSVAFYFETRYIRYCEKSSGEG